MSISAIRSKTQEIERLAQSETGSVHDCLKLLLELFSEAEQVLDQIDANDERAFRLRDEVIETQAQILNKAAALKAPLIRDALYKLALWRWWSASEIDAKPDAMCPADAVVYSAFLDLAEILGERGVLTDQDLTQKR